MDDTMWDIFICHAWEDKEEIARPLAEALQQAGLRVWYDKFELKVGDSLRQSINQGLRDSRYGVVILSPHFFEKQWAQKELNGLAARERKGKKVILPVWHKVHYEEILQFSPELADRLAISTDDGVKFVVQELLRVFPEKEKQREKRKKSRKARKLPAIRLRSEPLEVVASDAQKVFRLDENRRPLEYIQNEYEDQGEVVVDHATGLMWQKSGSPNYMTYQEAQEYVQQLNQERFAGHDDWRLPTIPELMSLLEPEKQSHDLYINPMFGAEQGWCWSADRRSESGKGSSGAAWDVDFDVGLVGWYSLDDGNYVRCVRSRQQESSHARQEPERETKPKPPSQKPSASSVIQLRSEPLAVSKREAQKVFELTTRKFDWGTSDWAPRTYIKNDYEDQGEVVVDHATGLIWQRSGSPEPLRYADAQKYVEELNRQKFADYDDWRLPTIPELMSLLEPGKQSDDLYIDPIFDPKQRYSWSADCLPKGEGGSSGAAWRIHFPNGCVHWHSVGDEFYIRCVRSRK